MAEKKKKIIGTISLLIITISCLILTISPFVIKAQGLGNGSSAVWDNELQTFTDKLVESCDTDCEKVDNIRNWIIQNINYDTDYNFSIYQSVELNQVLSTKKTVCFGYANLFAAMCRSQNIPCNIVDGVSKTDNQSAHSWNRIKIDNQWYDVDTTNDADVYQNGGSEYGFHIVTDKGYDENYKITKIY